MADPALGGPDLLAVATAVDQVERTGHGLLLQVFAPADQVKAAPGASGRCLLPNSVISQCGVGRWRRMRVGSGRCPT